MLLNSLEYSSERIRMRREEIEAEISRIYELLVDVPSPKRSPLSEHEVPSVSTSPVAFFDIPVLRSPVRDRRKTLMRPLIAVDSFLQKEGTPPSSSPLSNNNNHEQLISESDFGSRETIRTSGMIADWGIITELKILKSLFEYIEECGDEFIYRAPLKISPAQVESSARSIMSGQRPSKYGLRICCSMVIYIVQNHPNGMVTSKLLHTLQSNQIQDYKESFISDCSPQETHDIWFILIGHLETLITRSKLSLTQAASLYADFLCKTLQEEIPEEDNNTYVILNCEKINSGQNGQLKQLLATDPESEQFIISFQTLLMMMNSLELMDMLIQLEKKTEVDNVLQHLLHVFDYHGKAEMLLQYFIAQEIVAASPNSSILFRTNNFTTKVLGRYCKMYGKFFLENTIGKIVYQIRNTKFRTENIPALKCNKDYNALVQFMVDMIATSSSIFPPQLRFMCHIIKGIISTDSKFKEDPTVPYVGVCGIVFLRFLVPAITSPNHYQVTEATLPPEMPKKLALLAGELQSSVNRMTSSIKGLKQEGGVKNRVSIHEDKSFINQDTVLLANFCDKISTPVRDPASLPSVVTPEQYKDGMKYLIDLFQKNYQKILQNNVKTEPNNDQKFNILFGFLKMVLARRSRNIRKLESRTSSGSKPRKLNTSAEIKIELGQSEISQSDTTMSLNLDSDFFCRTK